MTHEVLLFCEDFAHEQFIGSLLSRLMREEGIAITVNHYSVTGGRPRLMSELREFVRDINNGRLFRPSLVVVATDANCRGYNDWRKDIEKETKVISNLCIYAIPDPHIERWMLIDSAAFQTAVGVGCNAPDNKCDKAKYKHLLAQEIENAGTIPLLGGIEYASTIAEIIDVTPSRNLDDSLGKFCGSVRTKINEWKNT